MLGLKCLISKGHMREEKKEKVLGGVVRNG